MSAQARLFLMRVARNLFVVAGRAHVFSTFGQVAAGRVRVIALDCFIGGFQGRITVANISTHDGIGVSTVGVGWQGSSYLHVTSATRQA